MSSATLSTLEASGLDQAVTVLQWRFDRLSEAGYELPEAIVLASLPQVDLHEAIDLVGRGCPPMTAARILI